MKALCVAAASGLFAFALPSAFAQDGGVNFVAEPVPGSLTDPAGGFFLLPVAPGAELTQAIGLRNDSDGPLEMQLAAVDAVTGQLGGASYMLSNETPSRTGAWIALERTAVSLAAKASAVVPFRVAVPPGAESGHHLAGISISAPGTGGGPAEAGGGQAGASVDVHTRRIIAVQVNVPGPAEPVLEIDGVGAVARPDGLHLEIALGNTGRALTKAKGVIDVGDDFRRDFDVDTFVPGTSIAYPVKWTADTKHGDYPARVELRYGDQVARWEGTFTVGPEVLEELANREVAPAQAHRKEDGSGQPVPALVAMMVGAAALAGGGRLMVSRRRRARRSRTS